MFRVANQRRSQILQAEVQVTLLRSERSPEGIAMWRQIDLKLVYVVSRPPDGWEGERGYINAEIMARHLPENRTGLEYFICGPDVMQQSAKVALETLGIPLDQVQSESFNFV